MRWHVKIRGGRVRFCGQGDDGSCILILISIREKFIHGLAVPLSSDQ